MKSNWKTFKLDEFIAFNPKETLKKGTFSKKIAMDILQPFCRDISNYEVTKYTGGTKFRNGDTIMARITPCLENGKTAKINLLDTDEIGFGSTEYIVLRAIPNISNEDFIYYLTCSPIIREPAIKSMVGSSGRQRVQINVLQNLEINLPPLETQKKIASILSALDDKIELNNKINENLEMQAQAIFKSWFVDFEPFGGVMPEDWKNCYLGDVTINNREKINNCQYPVFSAINTGNLIFSDDYFTKQVYSKDISKYIKVNKWDFAYNPARINIGSIGINELNVAGCVSPVYVVFSVQKEYHSFFRFYFKQSLFKTHCISRASGSVRQSLNYKDFSLIDIIYPSKKYALAFDDIWKSFFSVIVKLKEENQRLAELRDTLLPKLMNGEIDVDDVQVKE